MRPLPSSKKPVVVQPPRDEHSTRPVEEPYVGFSLPLPAWGEGHAVRASLEVADRVKRLTALAYAVEQGEDAVVAMLLAVRRVCVWAGVRQRGWVGGGFRFAKLTPLPSPPTRPAPTPPSSRRPPQSCPPASPSAAARA